MGIDGIGLIYGFMRATEFHCESKWHDYFNNEITKYLLWTARTAACFHTLYGRVSETKTGKRESLFQRSICESPSAHKWNSR